MKHGTHVQYDRKLLGTALIPAGLVNLLRNVINNFKL